MTLRSKLSWYIFYFSGPVREDDQLFVMLQYLCLFTRTPLNKFFLCITVFNIMVLFVSYLGSILGLMDIKVGISFMPVLSLSLFALVSMVINNYKTRKEEEILGFVKKWKSWKLGSLKVQKQILKDTVLLKWTFYIVFSIIMSLSLMLYPVFKSDENIHILVKLSNVYFPKVVPIVRAIYFVPSIYTGYVILTLPIAALYFFYNITIQIMLCVDSINNFTASDQNSVTKQLKDIIKQHMRIQRNIRQIMDMVDLPAIALAITGVLNPPTMFIFFSYQKTTLINYVRWIGVFIMTMFVSMDVTLIGQKLTDEYEKIFESSIGLPWYQWNKENKTLYNIFLVNCRRPIYINFRGVLRLNKEFLIKIFRITMSGITFYSAVKDRL